MQVDPAVLETRRDADIGATYALISHQ